MRTPLLPALFTLALTFFAPRAGAQCGTWQPLANLGYSGYTTSPATTLAANDVNGGLAIGTSCYCGYHGAHVPALLTWSGTSWGEYLVDVDVGWGDGAAYFDLGSGPELHFWGEASFPINGGFFWKEGSSSTGFVDATTGAGLLGAVTVFDDGSGPTYYAARAPEGIVRWDGTSWVNITPGGAPNGSVSALVGHDDGTGPALYAGGNFTSIGGIAALAIARFDGTSWSPLGLGLHSGIQSSVRVSVLRSVQDGASRALYAGGEFEAAGNESANGLARWSAAGWSGIGATLPMSPAEIGGVEWFEDGSGNGAAIVAKVDAPTPSLQRLMGTTWTALPAPGGTLTLRPGPMTQVRFPGSQHTSLVTTVTQSTGIPYTMAAYHGCDATGTLSCFGDGALTPCPCGNESASVDRAGCRHSLGTGGALRARGDPQLTHDTLVLDGSAMTNASVLYFQGASFHLPNPFGDGVKCVGGPFVRLGTKLNVSGASSYGGAGDPHVSIKGLIPGPSTRHYQARYRNPADFCTPETFNYTNSVTIVWQP